MRRVALVLLFAACGDDAMPIAADGPVADAAIADAPSIDTDALPPDLFACDGDHPCPDGTDCTRIPWLAGARRCLRRCNGTGDCGLNEICYRNVSDPIYQSMANHCYLSYCFAALGNCRLGAEVGLDDGDQRDGTCLPLDDQGAVTDGGVRGPIGQCLEAGEVGEDLPCELQHPQRGGLVCAQGMVCTGGATADIGRCQLLCDPTAVPDPCAAGRGCFDDSTGTTLGPVPIHATWGFCRIGTRCSLVSPGGCPSGSGCLPTNPIRADGFCSFDGAGAEQVGQSCVPFGVVAPSFSERCQEALCDPTGVDADAGPNGTCRQYCDLAHACAAGTCVPYTWDELGNLTQQFGVCR